MIFSLVKKKMSRKKRQVLFFLYRKLQANSRPRKCTLPIKILIVFLTLPTIIVLRKDVFSRRVLKEPQKIFAEALSSSYQKPESITGQIAWWFSLQFAIRLRRTGGVLPALATIRRVQKLLSPADETILYSANNLSFQPIVSIVVPNYNHAPYLNKRLESLFSQTYTNFEVILLDDCSTDESLEILTQWQQRYPERVRLFPNEQNSGGVFHQWNKGMRLAKGELIWIAESDDYCSENFLATLVPFFSNEAVMLAHCKTLFLDDYGSTWTTNAYLDDLSPVLWDAPFLHSAQEHMNKYLGIKNTIPNASGALFRKRDMPLLDDQKWLNMRLCGDWLFYIHLIRGGLIAYSNEATNYYRKHEAGTSEAVSKTDQYHRELEMVACAEARLYNMEQATLERFNAYSLDSFLKKKAGASPALHSEFFSLEKILRYQKERKLNILMCCYALTSGGGEHFPIFLANALANAGHAVTLVDFMPHLQNPQVRSKVSSNVPLITLKHRSITTIIDQFKPDIVHTHNALVDFAVAQSTARGSYAHVISLHGCYESIPDDLRNEMVPITIKSARRWLYTADKNLNVFQQADLNILPKACKLYNAVEAEHVFPCNRSAYGIPEDAFVLCLTSRAIAEKGWREAVEIVTLANQMSPRPIHLVLIGEGPMFDELHGNTPEFIHLLGFQKNVTNFFAMGDLGFLPSRFLGESLPLVNLHCFAAGKPVLASNVGDIAQQIMPEPGYPAGMTFALQEGAIPIAEVANIVAELANTPASYAKLLQNVPLVASKYDINTLAGNYVEQYKIAMAQSEVKQGS